MSDIKYSDIKVDGSTYEASLVKLIGKKIKDVRFYFSLAFGDVSVKLTTLVFEDDTMMSFEGEHDHPYLTDWGRDSTQPNFDSETLERLLDEQEAED